MYFLKANWLDIVMVNYTVSEKVLKPYLPPGVELDLFRGKPYISLVGFRFANSRIFNIPIPFYGSFDEVNLRFYVYRKTGSTYKRGVVFISEIVPHKVVAFLANTLYKEHYSHAPMHSTVSIRDDRKEIAYCWKKDEQEYSIKANFESAEQAIVPGTLEEFIYEHYYGYTKVSAKETWEYKVNHPQWRINTLIDYNIDCDFEKMHGGQFGFLNHQNPVSVFNAIGSGVGIDWRIKKIRSHAPFQVGFSL